MRAFRFQWNVFSWIYFLCLWHFPSTSTSIFQIVAKSIFFMKITATNYGAKKLLLTLWHRLLFKQQKQHKRCMEKLFVRCWQKPTPGQTINIIKKCTEPIFWVFFINERDCYFLQKLVIYFLKTYFMRTQTIFTQSCNFLYFKN